MINCIFCLSMLYTVSFRLEIFSIFMLAIKPVLLQFDMRFVCWYHPPGAAGVLLSMQSNWEPTSLISCTTELLCWMPLHDLSVHIAETYWLEQYWFFIFSVNLMRKKHNLFLHLLHFTLSQQVKVLIID